MSELAPYQERVVIEKRELDLKINKLETFIFRSGGEWFDIPAEERLRLTRQYCYMADYSAVLAERIAAFKKP